VNAFLLKLLVSAVQNPEIRAFLFEMVEKLADKLLPQIVATFPTFVAAAVKVFADKVPNLEAIAESIPQLAEDTAKHILDSDPDLPGISNIIDLSELARKWLNL
jgi:hypothetical protein